MQRLSALLRDYLVPLAQVMGIVFSFFTVRLALQARKEDRAYRRPNFTIEKTRIIKRREGPPHRVQLEMKNSGVHVANDIEVETTFLNDSITNKTTVGFIASNDAPGGYQINPTTDFELPGNKFPCYVVVAIKYKDGATRQKLHQEFFLKWLSYPDDCLHWAKRDERERMSRFLDQSN